MPHITLSIPQSVYETMKKHPEVKWTQIAREKLVEYADEIQGITTTNAIRRGLGPAFVKSIAKDYGEDDKTALKRIKEAKWNRMTSSQG
jgi:hypothetical protein